jgi:NADH dehydrogenase
MATSVVIVGGGFGGLEAAFSLVSLLGPTADITLIDRGSRHSFIPSIHEVVSGKVGLREIQVPLDAVLGPAGVRFVQDDVLSVDVEKQQVIAREQALQYDYLVLSCGAENNFFGVPGAQAFSYRFLTPEDAERIRTDLDRFMKDRGRRVHLVLAGGGTEGVEVAGELIDFIHDNGYGEDLADGRITVELIEGQSRVLPGFPSAVQDIAAEYLAGLDVKIITGDKIAEVRKDKVVLASGAERPFSLLIWTGGIRPSPLIAGLSLPKDPAGWLLVTDRLHTPEDEFVFGIGDAISIQGTDGPLRVRRLAYHAQDQAVVAALNIYAHARGRELAEYSPKAKPQLISLGRDNGIFLQGERALSGRWVIALKKAVERKHIMSCLSRPLTSRIASAVPGRGFLHRIKLRLPL